MPKGAIKLIPLKEVFSCWTPAPFGAGRRGLVLVEDGNGLRIEQAHQSGSGVKIFLGKVKKPTLQVGFLNACLAKICPADPERIQIPLLSRLEMERISEEFELMKKLEQRVRGLSLEVDLKIAKTL